MEESKFSRNKTGWYSASFSPKMPEVNKNSDGKPAAKKPKQNASPANLNYKNYPVLQVCMLCYFTRRKHVILQGELSDAKKELKLYNLKSASKCSPLSKVSKSCVDSKTSSKGR